VTHIVGQLVDLWVRTFCPRARSAVPFFFKQWGGVRKCTTGRELNGRTYDEMPELDEGRRTVLPVVA
jgi:protein gp37